MTSLARLAFAQATAQFEPEITTRYPFDSAATGTASVVVDPWGPSAVAPRNYVQPVARVARPSTKAPPKGPSSVRQSTQNGALVRVPWAELPMTLAAAQYDLSWRASLPSSGIASWGINPVQNPERSLVEVLIGSQVVGVGVVLEGGSVLTSLTAIGRGLELRVRFLDGAVEAVSVRRTHRAYDLALLEASGQRVRAGLPLARQVNDDLALVHGAASLRKAQVSPRASTEHTMGAPAGPSVVRVPLAWFGSAWGADGVPIPAALRPPQLTELGSPLVNSSGHLAAIVTLACVADDQRGSDARGCRITRVGLTSATISEFLGLMEEDVAHVRFGVTGETTDTGWARGVRVTGVAVASPAATAGLRAADGAMLGDVIVAINDTPVFEMEHLRAVLKTQRPGSKPVLTVLRQGRLEQVTVSLPSAQHPAPTSETPEPWVSF